MVGEPALFIWRLTTPVAKTCTAREESERLFGLHRDGIFSRHSDDGLAEQRCSSCPSCCWCPGANPYRRNQSGFGRSSHRGRSAQRRRNPGPHSRYRRLGSQRRSQLSDVDKPLVGGQGRAHSAGCHRIAGKGRRRISAATLIIHNRASRRSDMLVPFHGALRRVAAVAVRWIAVVAIVGRSFHYDVNPLRRQRSFLSGCVTWCQCVE